ncbi:Peptidase M23 [Gloeothece citriformis PCC 7424]|uniref:Peptidase M23 n=1 Tax=Gloeothece citriformis (strain PCC 7424) TaxID=65393 RepID=B7KEK2_GLOC7|nr:M23 family metallopeptidase [Gloeothece citriformis]ACK69027.1 Peptidase M23 [Gloeothece citriformis PCC 7424]
MKKTGNEGFSLLTLFNRSLLLKSSASFLGSLTLVSSGLVWTVEGAKATDNVLVIPETSAPAPAPPPTEAPVIIPKSGPVVAPVKSPEVKPVAPLKPRTIKLEPKPSVNKPSNTAAPKIQLSAPKISVPEVKQTSSPIMPQIQPTASGLGTAKNSYIDTNQYHGNPSKPYVAPPAVVLTERSTGCQTVSQNGQLNGGCGVAARKQPTQPTTTVAKTQQRANPPRNLTVARSLTVVKQRPQPVSPSRNLVAASQPQTLRVAQPISSTQVSRPRNTRPQPVSDSQVVSLQPIEMNGVKIALAPVPRYNRSAGLGTQVAPTTHKTDLIFPVAIPAKITSAFGWRVHPISGSTRMHEGTDIGAPMGTPVLAAYAGEVAVADWVGGYGLMVILRHLEGQQESRYAHLSEVYVQPGEQVEQGTVIGRVGSTGFSTGPHLHFEWRHLTEQGWVAVDAGLHLEYALENLIQSMPVAQATPNPEG